MRMIKILFCPRIAIVDRKIPGSGTLQACFSMKFTEFDGYHAMFIIKTDNNIVYFVVKNDLEGKHEWILLSAKQADRKP